jgi:aspartate/methionine/tyrosine aminotransferase
MFSSRLHWGLQPNALARLLEQQRRIAAPILDLTESNPTRVGLRYPEPGILAAIAKLGSLCYEPVPCGLLSAREAVADYYQKRGFPMAPERILLTASTSEAYAYLFKLLAEPGDEILIPRPSYPLFEFLAGLESVSAVSYPLRYHGGWGLHMEALASAIRTKTRALVIVNPNNPTGSFLKRRELDALASLCAQSGLAIISDEVFSDYSLAPDCERVPTLAGENRVLAFCLGGLSKAAGLPQLKLGWIALAGPSALRESALARLELIADTYLSLGTPVQHALPDLLALGGEVRVQIQERTKTNLGFLRGAIGAASPCTLLEVEGGWYAILQVPRTRSEEQWCLDLLGKDNVLVQPGYFYDLEGEAYLVVSLLPPPEIFTEGIRRLLARAAAR